ncbi:ParB/RepB/Spo0J family partition protein (plasmid) [Isosphaeraceae bacterium EP7]
MAGIDELRKAIGGNVADSTGRHGAPVYGSPAAGPRPVAADQQGVKRSKNAAEIETSRIRPDPNQPREVFDDEAIARLADSLKTRGQIQPIRVRWDEPSGVYLIVCGERRWRASMLAELPTMTCVIADGPVSSADLLAMQLVENMLREDLQPVEQAKAYRALMTANEWSVRQLARELALDHTLVLRSLSLLDLPTEVQDRVERGELSATSAYEVSKLEGDPEAQAEVAAAVVAGGLNRMETREAVRQATARKSQGRGAAARPRKPVVKTVRVAEGKITIELRKGLDSASIASALRSALAMFDGQEAAA